MRQMMLKPNNAVVDNRISQAMADSPTHELEEVRVGDLCNNRKRNPISRVFNATRADDLSRALEYCDRLNAREAEIAWWKVVELGDKIYVVGQWQGTKEAVV